MPTYDGLNGKSAVYHWLGYLCHMKHLVIFVSGSGTNMENIAHFFANSAEVRVVLVVCNKPGVEAIERAKRLHIPVHMINKHDVEQPEPLIQLLRSFDTDLIVLAGFLWLLPAQMMKAFPKRIINIHPALLPEFGGKGMYGMHVHKAVLKSGAKRSGITIHYVDEQYDAGEIIFQAAIDLAPDETPQSLAQRIHQLEYAYYPKVIEQVLKLL